MNLPQQLTADITTAGLMYGVKSAGWSLVKSAVVLGVLYLVNEVSGRAIDPTDPAVLQIVETFGGSYAGLTFLQKWLGTSSSNVAN